VKVIKVSAKRYEFIPNELTVKKGETVDIELTTHDVVMGFAVPDITRERTNILPGQVAHLRFTATKVGTFPFLCDVFCGSGHEDMDGTITVVE
jgi:cytochrome c oxidase subunit II